MRILYVNSNLTRVHTAPGVWGRQVLDALRAAGAAVSTFPDLSDADTPPLRAGASRNLRTLIETLLPRGATLLLLECGLVVRGVRTSLRTALWCWRMRHTHEVDVVLGRHIEYECSANLAARILRVPLVLEVHSPTFIERRTFGPMVRLVVRAIERRLWRRCAKIWVNSENLKTILVESGVEAARVHTIPFGVTLNPHARDASRGRRTDVRVIFVGSFYRWHGASVLLRAFGAARQATGNMRLLFVGDGSERTPCEELARALSLSDVVTFAGRLPHDEVMRLLADADIGVAPYTPLERFYFDPAKILEYQASGLAIIASDQGRVSDMLEAGRCGILVPPGDEVALRDALIRLVRDPELRETLGAAALQHASRQGWDRVAPLVLAVLQAAATSIPVNAHGGHRSQGSSQVGRDSSGPT